MNSERIILANYENIQEANHYANLLTSEGISCEIGAFAETQTPKYERSSSFQLLVEAKDEFMARVLINSDVYGTGKSWFDTGLFDRLHLAQAPRGQIQRDAPHAQRIWTIWSDSYLDHGINMRRLVFR